MIKNIFSALVLTLISSSGFALNLGEIVMQIDMNEPKPDVIYPCIGTLGASFCSKTVVLEKNCAKTLSVGHDTLSCKGLSGKVVAFATWDSKKAVEDTTQSGYLVQPVVHGRNVELKTFTTPNGNTEYQVIVK